MATRYKDTYFTTGGAIFHPTRTDSYIANKKTNLSTYYPYSNIKYFQHMGEFGVDRSSQQNDADPVTGERRYFFPPFALITEEENNYVL